MNTSQLKQGSPEWLAARIGLLTASRMAEAMDFTQKGGEGAKRKALKMEILAEMLTGQATPKYVSREMLWGQENEEAARLRYSSETGRDVGLVGLVTHGEIEGFGASPDGVISDQELQGLLEIKCPTSQTHLQYLLDGIMPEQYKPQVLAQMACTRATFCDFMSFDPRMPEDLQCFIIRYVPHADEIKLIEDEARKFLAEVEKLRQKVRNK